jgi:hypothetical protein
VSGGQLIFVLSLAVPVVAGFVIGRWRFLLVVLGIWLGIAIFLRENNGWYGAGWGDGGILLNVIWALLTFGLAALGVGLRKVTGTATRFDFG